MNSGLETTRIVHPLAASLKCCCSGSLQSVLSFILLGNVSGIRFIDVATIINHKFQRDSS